MFSHVKMKKKTNYKCSPSEKTSECVERLMRNCSTLHRNQNLKLLLNSLNDSAMPHNLQQLHTHINKRERNEIIRWDRKVWLYFLFRRENENHADEWATSSEPSRHLIGSKWPHISTAKHSVGGPVFLPRGPSQKGAA